jgi:hypothetical protein
MQYKLSLALGCCLLMFAVRAASAQTSDASPDERPARTLAEEQADIAKRYDDLEELFLKLARLSTAADPTRAALLKEAYGQSRQKGVASQLEALAKELGDDQALLGRVTKEQSDVQSQLKALLDLLQSEDRAKKIESENRRIREYLKQINRIIRQQEGVRGRTEGGDDPERLAEDQRRATERAKELREAIEKHERDNQPGDAMSENPLGDANDENGDSPSGKPGEGAEGNKGEPKGPDSSKPSPDQSPDEQPKSQEEIENKKDSPKEGDSQEGSSEPSEGSMGENSDSPPSDSQEGSPKPSDQPGSPGQPGKGAPSDQPPQDDKQAEENPVRRRLQEAEKNMRRAEEKLEKAEREGAIDDQERAIAELKQAKAELEKILRQLREEEIERVLAMLEGRFRRMLEMQVQTFDQTQRLDNIPVAERVPTQAGKLSRQQRETVAMCQRALNLIREEGSAVALAEATEQVRDDMNDLVELLARYEVGSLTQGIEKDVIEALEEIIAALEQAQKDQKDRKQQRPGSRGGQPVDPALVNILSELKVIRALQMRVNRRTETYSVATDGQQARDPEMVSRLEELSERQRRIVDIVRDIITKKTQ